MQIVLSKFNIKNFFLLKFYFKHLNIFFKFLIYFLHYFLIFNLFIFLFNMINCYFIHLNKLLFCFILVIITIFYNLIIVDNYGKD